MGAHWYGHHWYVALHRQPHSRSRSHWHDPRRRGAHHWYHGRTPPMWGASFIPGQGGPGRLGGGGIIAPAGGGAEWNRRYLSLLKQQLFYQSGSEPALLSISDCSLSHSLCASYHCSVSFSQMQNRITVVTKKQACCSTGHWQLCSP